MRPLDFGPLRVVPGRSCRACTTSFAWVMDSLVGWLELRTRRECACAAAATQRATVLASTWRVGRCNDLASRGVAPAAPAQTSSAPLAFATRDEPARRAVEASGRSAAHAADEPLTKRRSGVGEPLMKRSRWVGEIARSTAAVLLGMRGEGERRSRGVGGGSCSRSVVLVD